MNKRLLSLMLLLAIFTIATFAQSKQKTFIVEVENISDKNKIDNPVVIDLSKLKCGFNVKSAVVTMNSIEIPSQLDDLNRDARADELAFVADIPAKSKQHFKVVLSSEVSKKEYKPRTFAQMMVSNGKGKLAHIRGLFASGNDNVYNFVYHHGPAFESELVAYRVYFNEKQTIDPYGKFNKGLEIERSKFYPTAQQLEQGFGNDVLRVNNSCGVGALKGWNGTNTTHITPVVEREERVISSGPVRAIVSSKVIGWQYQGHELNMINRYTIYAGHRDIIIDAIFDEPLPDVKFASGVQKLKENSSMFTDNNGLLGSWGTDYPVNDTINYAKETVGIGTFIPKSIRGKEQSDKENYLFEISAKGEYSFRYHTTFTSQKEKFGFKEQKEWYSYLQEWKRELETPCKVKIISTKTKL